MCTKCEEIAQQQFADLPDEHVLDFLMSCTPYPFGSEEDIAKRIIELRSKTSNWQDCFAITDAELDEALHKSNIKPLL